MSKSLPVFRYHPDPLATGVIVPSPGICPVCNEESGFKYVGPFYSEQEVEGICPWCISSGEAAEKYDLTFVDEDEVEEVSDDALKDELTKRTPGYFFPQEDMWPVHCGDYCVLLGKVTWEDVASKLPVLQTELEEIRDRLEITDEILREDLRRENSPLWATLFKCKECDNYRLIADYA